MSDQFSVNRVGSVPNQEINYQTIQAQQAAANAAPTVRNVDQSEKKPETQKDKAEDERKQEKQAIRHLGNVEMQFEVNSDTNEITLKVLDKETREILRTIPERSWSDLSVAELFKITA